MLMLGTRHNLSRERSYATISSFRCSDAALILLQEVTLVIYFIPDF